MIDYNNARRKPEIDVVLLLLLQALFMAKFTSNILLFAQLRFPCPIFWDEKNPVNILFLEFAIGTRISRYNMFQRGSHFRDLIQ